LRQHRQFSFEELLIVAHQDVIELLLDEESGGLAELSGFIDKNVRLQAERLFAPDQYDVVLI
ncbi:MAG: Rne/Rng family ribonuclease, partial [Pseudomonadota bacterium]